MHSRRREEPQPWRGHSIPHAETRNERREAVHDPYEASALIQLAGGGNGTGFLVHKERGRALILTGAHVIQAGRGDGQARAFRGEVLVSFLGSKRTYEGMIVGASSHSDVAAIEIYGDDITEVPVTFGSGVVPGDPVHTYGTHRESAGIRISTSEGTVRQLPSRDDDRIITSVPVDVGNSGGPLINDRGEVVGMMIQMSRDSGEGRAVSADELRSVTAEMVRLTRGS